ncbi:MAG: 50S ribosomal protein L10 [Phycisphaerales bacterium]
MSRPVKEMIVDDYKRRFADVENALVIDVRGIEANENNALRLDLLKKEIRVTVVKNTLARKAFEGGTLESLTPALDGPAAVAYGAESVVEVARALVDWAKKVKQLELKGACLDGEFFEGDEGVKRLSTFPTRIEAQAKVVQLLLSPARNLVGCALAPGGNITSILKTIQEKLEGGEVIAKVN